MAVVREVQGRDKAAGGGGGVGCNQAWVCPACQVRLNYSSSSLNTGSGACWLFPCIQVHKIFRVSLLDPLSSPPHRRGWRSPSTPKSQLTCGCSGSETQAMARAKEPRAAPLCTKQLPPADFPCGTARLLTWPHRRTAWCVKARFFLRAARSGSFWRCPSDMRRMFRNMREGYSKLKYPKCLFFRNLCFPW